MYRGINNLFWVASFPVKYILNINTKLYIYRYIDIYIYVHTHIYYIWHSTLMGCLQASAMDMYLALTGLLSDSESDEAGEDGTIKTEPDEPGKKTRVISRQDP